MLLFRSGRAHAARTGRHAALPCTIDGPLRADCTCYAVTEASHMPGTRHNFVLVGSILNPQIREETELQCREDGSNCLNMANLASGQCNPDDPHISELEECQPAPVCSHLGDLETGATQTLYPETDATLISTFSFVSSQVHDFGSHACEDNNIRLYAGCMTAPCTDADGDGLAECACPLYDGDYQVGQDYDGLQCNILPNVWSAANNATSPPPHLPGALAEE